MITDAEKIEVIKWVVGLKDREVLKQIRKIKEKAILDSKDWWESLTPDEKSSIERGIEDSRRKKVVAHAEMWKKYETQF